MFEEDWVYGANAWGNDYGKKEPDGKPKYNDKYGVETSYTGGKGWVAIGSEPYTRRWMAGAGRDGLTEKSERSTRNVYAKVEDIYGPQNPAEEEEEPEKEASPRDTGEYEDILGALKDDFNTAKTLGDYYKHKQPQPIGDPVAPGPDPGIAANTDLISTLGQQFQDQLAALSQGQEARYAALEGVLNQQSEAMAASQQMMQQQMMAAQQSYNEQLRMMQNMQKANVPEAEENAFTAQIGDQRENVTRRKEDNQLSDLSILSGLGTQGSPTAGFSLA